MRPSIISSHQTYVLRNAVLWPHLDKEDCGLAVDEDVETFHVGIKAGELVVATFLNERNETFSAKRQYRLRAMATAKEQRGNGLGKQVVEFGLEKLKSQNVEMLWCDARKAAIGFYEKLGFCSIGDWYLVPKIGQHKLMYINCK